MANALTLISETVLSSPASSVSFTSIPGTYKDLVLEFVGSLSSGPYDSYMVLNSDTGSNYGRTWLGGDGTSASSGRNTNFTSIPAFYMSTSLSSGQAHVMSYANTSIYKSVLIRNSSSNITSGAVVGCWRSTAAITSLSIGQAQNFTSGSIFRLWGVS